eukprot:7839600-Lingulodinium_polyedra.AAC.1
MRAGSENLCSVASPLPQRWLESYRQARWRLAPQRAICCKTLQLAKGFHDHGKHEGPKAILGRPCATHSPAQR